MEILVFKLVRYTNVHKCNMVGVCDIQYVFRSCVHTNKYDLICNARYCHKSKSSSFCVNAYNYRPPISGMTYRMMFYKVCNIT